MRNKNRGASIAKVLAIIVGGFIFLTVVLVLLGTAREGAEKEATEQEVVVDTEERLEDKVDVIEEEERPKSSLDIDSKGEWADIGGDRVYYDDKGGMWTITASDRYNWDDAMSYCSNLSYAGYNDWHLPSKEQLREDFGNSACSGWSGSDWEGGQPSCSLAWDPGSGASYYWSSSESSSNRAWDVHFSSGNVHPSHKYYSRYVRCRLGH